MIFLNGLFGYLCVLIILKWATGSTADLYHTLIYMFLSVRQGAAGTPPAGAASRVTLPPSRWPSLLWLPEQAAYAAHAQQLSSVHGMCVCLQGSPLPWSTRPARSLATSTAAASAPRTRCLLGRRACRWARAPARGALSHALPVCWGLQFSRLKSARLPPSPPPPNPTPPHPTPTCLQVFLLLMCFIAVPWMLLPKPFILKKRHEARSQRSASYGLLQPDDNAYRFQRFTGELA